METVGQSETFSQPDSRDNQEDVSPDKKDMSVSEAAEDAFISLRDVRESRKHQMPISTGDKRHKKKHKHPEGGSLHQDGKQHSDRDSAERGQLNGEVEYVVNKKTLIKSLLKGNKHKRKKISEEGNVPLSNAESDKGGPSTSHPKDLYGNLLYDPSTFSMLGFPQFPQDVMKMVRDSVRMAKQYDLLKPNLTQNPALLHNALLKTHLQLLHSFNGETQIDSGVNKIKELDKYKVSDKKIDEATNTSQHSTAMENINHNTHLNGEAGAMNVIIKNEPEDELCDRDDPVTSNAGLFNSNDKWFTGELNGSTYAEFVADVPPVKRKCWDGTKQYFCPECGKGFTQKNSLRNHLLIHSGIKNFHCDVCEGKFKTMPELKRHKLIHNAEKMYPCKICKKEFIRSGDLKKHELIHKGEKRHECTECFRKFTQSGDLKRHYYTHSGERRYGCDVCQRRFTRQSDLKHHKLVHTGEKHCMCDLCGKYFKSQREMKRHRMVHDEIKKFACNFCDKRFSQLPGLQQHKVVHSGERKHECDVCFKRFTQSGTLKRHKLIHEKYEKLKQNILMENGTEVNIEFDMETTNYSGIAGDSSQVEGEVCVKMEEQSDDCSGEEEEEEEIGYDDDDDMSDIPITMCAQDA